MLTEKQAKPAAVQAAFEDFYKNNMGWLTGGEIMAAREAFAGGAEWAEKTLAEKALDDQAEIDRLVAAGPSDLDVAFDKYLAAMLPEATVIEAAALRSAFDKGVAEADKRLTRPWDEKAPAPVKLKIDLDAGEAIRTSAEIRDTIAAAIKEAKEFGAAVLLPDDFLMGHVHVGRVGPELAAPPAATTEQAEQLPPAYACGTCEGRKYHPADKLRLDPSVSDVAATCRPCWRKRRQAGEVKGPWKKLDPLPVIDPTLARLAALESDLHESLCAALTVKDGLPDAALCWEHIGNAAWCGPKVSEPLAEAAAVLHWLAGVLAFEGLAWADVIDTAESHQAEIEAFLDDGGVFRLAKEAR